MSVRAHTLSYEHEKFLDSDRHLGLKKQIHDFFFKVGHVKKIAGRGGLGISLEGTGNTRLSLVNMLDTRISLVTTLNTRL